MDMPDGFIPLPPRVEPQAVFRPLLDDLRRTLARPPFERALHSVYLYGSVARGEAIAGRSDLDLTLVLRDPPSSELAAQLETARLTLQARHPEVSKIDFDIGHLAEARDPANRHSWGYWLKHRCRCLWGEDLAAGLAPSRPSKAIALALNGDYAQVLEDYAGRLDASRPAEESRRLQREAAKKLIRSSDVLRGEAETAWPETLEHYLALFHARHPEQAPALEYFKAVLDGQAADPAEFAERLRAFGAWMQDQERTPPPAGRTAPG
ncbi:nucleotidyltransferase domain-containing protein [Pseudomonas aeruginosa]|uniref:nucleotidyltransferase domain-containing protein n=1 Tax=Pseudomonas paraeruginosa TaxID=2994495 RepID=UPI001A20F28E|nr:nucleotidyltransferase domain-containing protein [Pseudomonas aeruginosa]MBG7024786.1 nucleotidyltransferase domain-containing protein [Pseudomonas aeruginosa]MBG7369027.1 nucleotidyltransferase domain-containing protein [Pseudomonas aeruginosa]